MMAGRHWLRHFHITERREAPLVTANTLNRRRGHHGAKIEHRIATATSTNRPTIQ
jgi:hypothetical protein